jgi:hypothetical protein
MQQRNNVNTSRTTQFAPQQQHGNQHVQSSNVGFQSARTISAAHAEPTVPDVNQGIQWNRGGDAASITRFYIVKTAAPYQNEKDAEQLGIASPMRTVSLPGEFRTFFEFSEPLSYSTAKELIGRFGTLFPVRCGIDRGCDRSLWECQYRYSVRAGELADELVILEDDEESAAPKMRRPARSETVVRL